MNKISSESKATAADSFDSQERVAMIIISSEVAQVYLRTRYPEEKRGTAHYIFFFARRTDDRFIDC